MYDNVKVARLISGETAVFDHMDSEEFKVRMKNPHVLVQTNQGAGLAPLMPWAVKGQDFVIEIAEDKVMFWYPQEQSEPVIKNYIQAVSTLDLSGIANVAQLKPN